MKLLIRNLSRSTTETELLEMFQPYGTVQSCILVTDAATRASKGFGFVVMTKPGDAKAAMKELNGTEVRGSRIRVKKASKKPAPGGSEETSVKPARGAGAAGGGGSTDTGRRDAPSKRSRQPKPGTKF